MLNTLIHVEGLNMAEPGSFRTGIRGFNKADVLKYIDAMQSSRADELSQYENQIEQLQRALSSQETYVAELKRELSENEEKFHDIAEANKTYQKKSEDTTKLLTELRRVKQETDILKLEKQELSARLRDMRAQISSVEGQEQEITTLREQADRNDVERQQLQVHYQETVPQLNDLKEEKDNLASELRQTVLRLEQAERQIADVRQDNTRYDAFSGDVGSFIMELHSMGQRFLETAYKRSDSCLGAVEASVFNLSTQLVNARSQIEKARQALQDQGSLAGLRLDELVQSLEETSAKLVEPDSRASDSDQ
jgi:chromosome segregation ATPase